MIGAFALLMFILAVTLGTFTGGSWGAIGIAGSIILFLATWVVQRGKPPINKPVMIFILVVLAIMAMLTLQAAHPDVSWHMVLQQASIMLPLALLFHPDVISQFNQQRFFPVVTGAAALAAATFGAEVMLGTPLLHAMRGMAVSFTEYNRGISYLAVFSFPLMAYLWVKRVRWQTAVFIALILIPVLLTESRATRMAFFIGGAVTIAAHLSLRLTHRALVISVGMMLMMPFLVTQIFVEHQDWVKSLPPSWHHRVEIWDYMSYRIFEKPWEGWGIGSSHLLPYAQPHGLMYNYVPQLSTGHPHNFILQCWVELGIGGLLICVTAITTLLGKATRLPITLAPFALGAWAAALCISSVAYSFWDDSLLACFAMTILAFIVLSKVEGMKNGTTA